MTAVRWGSRPWVTGMLCILVLVALGTLVQRYWLDDERALHVTRAEWLTHDSSGFDVAPAQIDATTIGGAWTAVSLPHFQASDLLRQAEGNTEGITTSWYRVRLSGLVTDTTPLLLYAARLKAEGPITVYVDGHRIYEGQLAGANWYAAPLWVALDAGERAAAPRELLIRMQHARASHPALASLWIGPCAAVEHRYYGRQWLQVYLPLMSSGAFLVVGLFSLFVYFKRGGGAGYGLFGLMAVTQVIRALHFFLDIKIANDWFAWFTLNSLFWGIAIVHGFQVLMHGQRQRVLAGILLAVNIGVALLSLPVAAIVPNTPHITPLFYLLAMSTSIAVTVAGFAASWRKSNEAMLLSATLGLCVIYGINDWALQSNFLSPEAWYLGPYMNLQNVGVFCYLMYRRYTGALALAEQSNVRLADSLRIREAELAKSYERLSEIEHKQTVAEERQRLMEDMHDGLGSYLHSALHAIERGKLDAGDVSDILRSCIDDLHLTIDSMEPVEADLLLLLATLRYRLGFRLQNAGIALQWDVVDVARLDWIDPRTALHILRILQEALTNIVKHTKARSIRVATATRGDGVLVCIMDDGAGFDVEVALQAGGRGLVNQRRRAAAIGGRIEWTSGSGGTKMILWLPQQRSATLGRPYSQSSAAVL